MQIYDKQLTCSEFFYLVFYSTIIKMNLFLWMFLVWFFWVFWVFIFFIFSSLELKALVSFSDHLSSHCLYVCLSVVCLSVCKLFTFSSCFPEPLGQFQPNFSQSIFLGKRDSSLFKWRATPFKRGENCKIVKIHCPLLKFLLQNHMTNFKQTWHKASLCEGDSSLFT